MFLYVAVADKKITQTKFPLCPNELLHATVFENTPKFLESKSTEKIGCFSLSFNSWAYSEMSTLLLYLEANLSLQFVALLWFLQQLYILEGLSSRMWLLNRFPIKYPSFIYLHWVGAEIFVIEFTAVWENFFSIEPRFQHWLWRQSVRAVCLSLSVAKAPNN